MHAALILGFVSAERAAELAWARQNTRALLRRGAEESAPDHYPWMVGFHGAWLAGLWLLAWDRQPDPAWLAAFGVAQALRFWVLVTLGRRWTTRIIVLRQAPLIRTGAYRWISHPNYVAVAAEIAIVPLAFGLWGYAAAASFLNALLLALRIRAETAALARARPLTPAGGSPGGRRGCAGARRGRGR
ncbi:MAG: isoprenylcysteine carboxylmethyltransferase family protein [Microvirga sp.]